MIRGLTLGLILAALQAPALDRYVSLEGGNTPPFTNWAMAATDLRTAVNWANTNNAGDIVWVSNGIHTVSVPVFISNVTVRGLSTAAADVVVSAGGATQCFILRHADARLSYLTVSNGYNAVLALARGGAVTIETGTVSDAVIGWSYAVNGGGVLLRAQWPEASRLERCLVYSNVASTYGGGVKIADSYSGTLLDCTVLSNRVTSTGSRGGGIHTASKNAEIHGCLVAGNSTPNNGGGIYFDSTGCIWNCTIENNVCDAFANTAGYGGGLHVSTASTNVDIRYCIVRHNTANVGGGVALNRGVMRGCLIADNLATNAASGGGGLYTKTAIALDNCTLVANRAFRGGGIYQWDTNGLYANCIIYHNVSTDTGHTNEVDGSAVNTNQYFYCCATLALTASQGNLRDNPSMVDVSAGNYRLQPDSLCVNTGTNLPWMDDALDLDGHRRRDWASRLVDRGAYERVPAGALIRIQ